jgi:predicted negative regulator of RcsB-dependent stress response
MSQYEDEDQAEKVKAWWKENWKALAAGLALGLAGIIGWEQYKAHQENTAATASQLYEEFKQALAASKADESKKLANKLKADYAKTPYPAHAQLKLAQTAVDAGKFDDALLALDWVTANAHDEQLRPLAQLRAARVLAEQGKTDAALAKLSAEVVAVFPAMAEEARGDLLLAKGDRKAARASYSKALAATKEEAAGRAALQQKIDDLADAA